MENKNTIRIDKYLANAGISSRRRIKEMLKQSQILVNNKPVVEAGERIDPLKDSITVNGQKLNKRADLVYILLNKPLDVVSTTSDELGRTTVTELIDSTVRIYPVGRLDADSIGLILLTNDGELTHKLTHPKHHIDKTYEVLVQGKVSEDQLSQLGSGVYLKDGLTAPAKVRVLEEFKFTTKLEFIIHEGKNRQIRRMCAMVGLEVLELKRVAIGKVKLGELKPGESRILSETEVDSLRK